MLEFLIGFSVGYSFIHFNVWGLVKSFARGFKNGYLSKIDVSDQDKK